MPWVRSLIKLVDGSTVNCSVVDNLSSATNLSRLVLLYQSFTYLFVALYGYTTNSVTTVGVRRWIIRRPGIYRRAKFRTSQSRRYTTLWNIIDTIWHKRPAVRKFDAQPSSSLGTCLAVQQLLPSLQFQNKAFCPPEDASVTIDPSFFGSADPVCLCVCARSGPVNQTSLRRLKLRTLNFDMHVSRDSPDMIP